MNFGTALDLMKEGYYVTRDKYRDRGYYHGIKEFPLAYDSSDINTHYIFMSNVNTYQVESWSASSVDLLANDWELVVLVEEGDEEGFIGSHRLTDLQNIDNNPSDIEEI